MTNIIMGLILIATICGILITLANTQNDTPKKKRKLHNQSTPTPRATNNPPKHPIPTIPQTTREEIPIPTKQPETHKGLVPEFADKTLAQKKGAVGEQIIKVLALSKLNPQQYRYFGNLIIPNGKGGTTQIDNIIVSPFGIFVIEAKYYSGWIFGQTHDKTWTCTYPNASKQPFKNPLHQNYGHIKSLENLLKQPENHFRSIIVFTHRECVLKTRQKMPDNVCLSNDFITHIQTHTETLFSTEQLKTICNILNHPQFAGTDERIQQHIQQLTQP